MLRALSFLTLLLVIPSSTVLGKKPIAKEQGETGTLLDTDRARIYIGTYEGTSSSGQLSTYGNQGTYTGSSSSSQTAKYRVYQDYVVASPTHIYIARQRLRWRWSKPAQLTVNAPIELKVKGDELWIRDEKGKIRKMALTKKILKTAPSPP